MSRSLAFFSMLGLMASTVLLWTFKAVWDAFDIWDRTLAVLLVMAVWGCVAAAVATASQAFRRFPRTEVERHETAAEPQRPEVPELSVVVPDARGEFVEALDGALA